jgi:RNA polymerase-binding transcription factor DksA
MDNADMADKHILEFLDRAVAAARGIRCTEVTAMVSGVYCDDCGEAVPLKRRQTVIGCKHCIDCAKLNELKQKGIGRSGVYAGHFYDADDSLTQIEF